MNYRTIPDVETVSVQAVHDRAIEAHKAFFGAELEVRRLEDLRDGAETEATRDGAVVGLEQGFLLQDGTRDLPALTRRDLLKADASARCARARIRPGEKREAEQQVLDERLREIEKAHVGCLAVLGDLQRALNGKEPDERTKREIDLLEVQAEVRGRAVELYQRTRDSYENRATRRAQAKTSRRKGPVAAKK
jgi:hypothetical protein